MTRLRGTMGLALVAIGALILTAPLAARQMAGRVQPAAPPPPVPVTAGPAEPDPRISPEPAPEPTPEPKPAPKPEPKPEPRPTLPEGSYRLEIPAIGLGLTVVEGIDDADLDRGPGHYPLTPLPGDGGNAAIAGHRTKRGLPSFFYRLNELEAGDLIRVVYPDRTVAFRVKQVFLTSPFDLAVLNPTEGPALTLTTCDPPGGDARRLIVRAELEQ